MALLGDIENGLNQFAQGFRQGVTPPPQRPIAPPPPMNPLMQRVNQYTTLMQQADPMQRQMLIGHLVDQYNQGNHNVAPYLQDLQAKGLLSQQGLTAGSSSPINPYTANPVQALGNLAYRGVNALAEGATSILPEQTAGEVMDAYGRPSTQLSGHAATNADLVRTALADRLFLARGLPGLAGRETAVEGNIAQKGLQRTLQNAPQFMGAGAIQSFNNQGRPVTPGQQFQRTVQGAAGGLGLAAVGGFGGELIHPVVQGIRDVRAGMVNPLARPKDTLVPQAGTGDLGGDVTGKEPTYYHGTTTDFSGEFKTGAANGRGEQRNYIYLTDNPDLAAAYAKGRTAQLGMKGDGQVVNVQFKGKTFDQSPTAAHDLMNKPEFKQLSVRSQNQLGNLANSSGDWPTGIVETNPELVNFLKNNGYDAIDFAHTGADVGGRKVPRQFVVINPDKAKVVKSPVKGEAPTVEQPRQGNGQFGNKPTTHFQPRKIDESNPMAVGQEISNLYKQRQIENERYQQERGAASHATNTRDYNRLVKDINSRYFPEFDALDAERARLTKIYQDHQGKAPQFTNRQVGAGELSGDITGRDRLHLNEPTPAHLADLNDPKSIGNAIGKTKAYIGRLDDALARSPKDTEIRNRRVQLAQELKELQTAYRNPSPFKSKSELGGGKEAAPVSNEARNAQEVIDTLAKERADQMRSTDQQGGVSTIKTDNGYKRASSNSPFYRQYFKQHGKVPTLKAYLEEAHRQLRTGSDDEAASYQEALRAVNKDFKDTQDYARAFGISEEQAAKELAEKSKNTNVAEVRKNPAASKSASTLINQAEQAKVERQMKAFKNAPAPTSLPEAKTTQEAVRNMDTANQLILNRTNRVAALVDRQLGKDPATMRAFAQALEHPEQANHLAQTTNNPAGFMKAIEAHKELSNYIHSLRQGVGAPVPYVKNYVQHQWDLSDPKMAEEFARLAQMKGKAANARVFDTIDEGEAAGFKLKPQSTGQLVRSYGRNEASAVSKQALMQSLERLHPDEVADINSGAGSLRQNGQAFRQLQVPGLENYQVSPRLYKQLQGIQHNLDQHTVTKVADTINTAMKQVSLSFGGFHDLNESLRFAGQELVSLRPSGLVDLVQARHEFFSPKAHEASLAEWQQSGLLDAAAKANLSGGQGADVHSISGRIEKLNPANEALFGREINFYKLRTFEKEVKRLGIKDLNTLSESDLTKLRKVASQINNWYGGLNLKIINRSPITQQFLRFITLAPDFQEGGFRTLGNAVAKFGKDNPEGNLARRQLMGNAVAVAIAAYVTSRMLGQNPQNFAQSLIDPQVKLPFKSPTGKAIVASLPSGPISEVGKAIGDPGHFLTSHMAAVPSVGVEAIQGKDYYGNPLVDPFKNPNPSFIQNVGGAVKSKVPIALGQGQKAFNGSENAGEALINTFGGRVKNDPNDPANQAAAAYFKSRDQFTKSLNPNDLALFNTLNPVKKDSSGNPVYTKSSLTNASDYAKLLDPANKSFADKYAAWQQSQPGHDPLWDLTPDSRRAYMFTQVLGKYDPKGDPATTKYLQSLIPSDFYARRSAWFNSLPSSAQSASNIPQAPQMTPQLQGWYDQYYSKLPSGTGARSQALNTPMGQLFQSYMNASDAFTNQQRVSMGLPAIAAYGAAVGPGQIARPSSGSSSSGSKGISRSTAKRNIKNQYKFASNELTASKKKYKTTKYAGGKLTYGKVTPKNGPMGYLPTPGEKRISPRRRIA